MLAMKNAPAAVEKLKPMAEKPGDDQLVYLLDYATALQSSGDYKASTEQYLVADKLMDIKDYHSVSKQTAALLTSERMVQYKGENYEKVLVNAMLAVNFLMQNNLEAALVESRRVNEKLDYLKSEGEEQYVQNEFALYMSAIIWETNNDYDDAYIAYNDVYKLGYRSPQLEKDLLRSSYLSKRWSAHGKWKKEFKHLKTTHWKPDPKGGEVIMVYLQGWSPRKGQYPRDPRILEMPNLPYLYKVTSYIKSLRLTATSSLDSSNQHSSLSYSLFNLNERSMKTYNDQMAALFAKRVAAAVAKKAVADKVRKENEDLGNILHLFMLLSDQADLRQWSTLPESFQVVRMSLPAGEYKMKLEHLNQVGGLFSQEEQGLKVEAGKKTFLLHRTFN